MPFLGICGELSSEGNEVFPYFSFKLCASRAIPAQAGIYFIIGTVPNHRWFSACAEMTEIEAVFQTWQA
ncbi:hypothetical protein B1207_04705 [Legionella quinlivanii]|uniref:Uncharacterized protein n=1 Tax=Legionella quinlivanii TaxID=45073 RepID=A0A364LLR4_9GAMM|nr:hypothetical protein B1207_04705 [Legionella quinlivanii]